MFAAVEIGNLLEQHPATVTARIGGVCASAATIIACHCNKVIAANDSTYMVHPVSMYCGYANAADLQKYLEALATIKENIISLYAKKTGRTKEEVTAWMDAESWWTGPQAKENGFADELTDEGAGATYENRGGVLFVNSVSMGAKFDKAPEFVRNRVKRVVNNQPAGQPGKQQEVQDMDPKDSIKTVDDLRKVYPTLVDQIEQAAATAAAEAATNAERARIKDLEEMALAGSEVRKAHERGGLCKGPRQERKDPGRNLSGTGEEGRGEQRRQRRHQRPARRYDQRRRVPGDYQERGPEKVRGGKTT